MTPDSVYDYNVKTGQRKLLKEQPVLGGYDRSSYESERIWATADDGTKVPISMVYRKGLESNGQRPMLLRGYGSYGFPYDVRFSSSGVSLLDRGMIVAMAHIRGGGEIGKTWHDGGRMMTKRNTFTDFIAGIGTSHRAEATRRPTDWSSREAVREGFSWAQSRTCGPISTERS